MPRKHSFWTSIDPQMSFALAAYRLSPLKVVWSKFVVFQCGEAAVEWHAS